MSLLHVTALIKYGSMLFEAGIHLWFVVMQVRVDKREKRIPRSRTAKKKLATNGHD
jgi:hypothetical protein